MDVRVMLLRVLLALGALGLVPSAAHAYDQARITNNTPYTITGTVRYTGCSNDKYTVAPGRTWVATDRRGLCLIHKIGGRMVAGSRSQHGERLSVTPYESSGTGYSEFRIEAYGDSYRIFSRQEFAKVSNSDRRASPGFRFVNHTQWPVAFSLEQAGCLYYDVIPAKFNGNPGTYARDTGAVWFTLRMHIQPDGRSPLTDADCVQPVVEIVGEVALGVLSGGTSLGATAGRVAAKQVAKKLIKEAAKESVQVLATYGARKFGEYLMENGSVVMAGQYAGYAWPFQCRRMPEYHITGGPEVLRDETGAHYLAPGSHFTVTKQNACGNDMMRLSPKTARSQGDPATLLKVFEAAGGFESGGASPIEDSFDGSATNYVPPSSGSNTSGGNTPGRNGPPGNPLPNGPFTTSGVNAGNLVKVDAGRNVFRQTATRQWTEFNSSGRAIFTFEETGRDEYSVYVIDRSRDIRMRIDLYRKMVLYAPPGSGMRDLYRISRSYRIGREPAAQRPRQEPSPPSSSPPAQTSQPRQGGVINGYSVGQVDYDGGRFVRTVPKRWLEIAQNGNARYNFAETQRDEWSVYLVDRSRNVSVQLDLHRKMISIGPIGGRRGDAYRITRSYREGQGGGSALDNSPRQAATLPDRTRDLQAERNRQQRAAEEQRRVQAERQRQQRAAEEQRRRQAEANRQRQQQQQQQRLADQRRREQQAAAQRSQQQQAAEALRRRQAEAAQRLRQQQEERRRQAERQQQQRAQAQRQRQQREAQLAEQRRRQAEAARAQAERSRQAQGARNTGVNGRNVQRVDFPGGSFRKKLGPGWAEYDAAGRLKFTFIETGRDDWSVYLQDRSRNVQVQLDLHRKMISVGPIGGRRNDLYRVSGSR